MNRKLMTFALLAMLCLNLGAAERRHEISVSGGYVPGHWFAGYDFNYLMKNGIYYNTSFADTYFDASTYEVEKSTLTWSLNYLYNFNKTIAVGAVLAYEGGSQAFYKRSDDSLINKENKNILSTLATFRATWLNRRYVRMYSLIGAGARYSMEGDFSYPINHLAFQIAPLGISVGKDLYGHVEFGVGTLYMGFNLGIGYRF